MFQLIVVFPGAEGDWKITGDALNGGIVSDVTAVVLTGALLMPS